ncbi:MAG: PEP-CTERM sorting domain-containing protein [Bryobacterales bacterium]|nr:PEP-CTERM sorting domain-containing protein [Bryobacterales bacterium]
MLFVRTLIFVLGVLGSAGAAPLYVNGAPTDTSGNEMTSYVQAEAFQLTSASTLTGARIWGFYFGDLGRGYLGSLSWQIYADASNQPGYMLYSGIATPLLSGGTSNCCDGISIQMDFSLPSIALAAGTYWLGLHNGPMNETATEYFYWQTSAENGTGKGKEQAAPFGNTAWVDNNLEHAFELEGFAQSESQGEGVPEPSTWILAGLGLAAGCARRRARAL